MDKGEEYDDADDECCDLDRVEGGESAVMKSL